MKKLHNLIFLGMIVGVAVGILLWWFKRGALEAGQPTPGWIETSIWCVWAAGSAPAVALNAIRDAAMKLDFIRAPSDPMQCRAGTSRPAMYRAGWGERLSGNPVRREVFSGGRIGRAAGP